MTSFPPSTGWGRINESGSDWIRVAHAQILEEGHDRFHWIMEFVQMSDTQQLFRQVQFSAVGRPPGMASGGGQNEGARIRSQRVAGKTVKPTGSYHLLPGLLSSVVHYKRLQIAITCICGV